jgi:hypothetical protein
MPRADPIFEVIEVAASAQTIENNTDHLSWVRIGCA